MEIMGGRGLIPMVTCVPSLIWDLQNSKWMLQQEQEATGKRECKGGRTDADSSFMLKAVKMLRPSCIPWELRGPEMNEGTAAMHYFSCQGQKYSDDQQHTRAVIHH